MGKDVYCNLICTTRARTVIGFAWHAMLKNITVLLLMVVALRTEIVEGSAGLRFSGRLNPKTADSSHAEYEPWNWRANATLQFFFQTSSHEDALIFYQDDGARKDQFMDLFLLNGKARFRARVGQAMEEIQRRVIERDFADSKWHQVKIEVSEEKIMFSIDDIRPAERTIKFTQNAESTLNAPLYIAGIPLLKLKHLSYRRIFNEVLLQRPPALFEGCIGDVRINRSPHGRLERARLRKPPIDAAESCYGACAERRCYHGRCIDRIRESECDCSGTGYEGDNCETSSKIVLMNALKDGEGYIYQFLESNSPYLSTERNTLDFRFLSLVKDGVIFYMGKDKDHLLVELVNGSIRVQANFGGGPVVVQLGKNALSDSCWYYTVIRRRKTRLTVILKNDRGEEIGRETRNSSASHVTLNLNNQSNVIYYGGGPPEVLRRVQAKPLFFRGYLQQFRFEEFNVIDSALSDKNGFSITDEDRVLQARPSNMLLQAAEDECKEKEGSGCSPADDDSDSCKSSTTPTEGTTRSTTPSSTPTTPTRNPPKPETQRSAEQKAPPTPRAKGVSAWVIILIVLAAMVLVFVSVFLLYRWNHRYTGSFKPNKNAEGQPQEPEPEGQQQGTRVYNQPAFFVYKPPKKPPTAQSPPVSI